MCTYRPREFSPFPITLLRLQRSNPRHHHLRRCRPPPSSAARPRYPLLVESPLVGSCGLDPRCVSSENGPRVRPIRLLLLLLLLLLLCYGCSTEEGRPHCGRPGARQRKTIALCRYRSVYGVKAAQLASSHCLLALGRSCVIVPSTRHSNIDEADVQQYSNQDTPSDLADWGTQNGMKLSEESQRQKKSTTTEPIH